MNAHDRYLDFLRRWGDEFSPMCPLREAIRFGSHEFWTIEGLWQGTKIMRIESTVRTDLQGIPHTVLRTLGQRIEIWSPAACHGSGRSSRGVEQTMSLPAAILPVLTFPSLAGTSMAAGGTSRPRRHGRW